MAALESSSYRRQDPLVHLHRRSTFSSTTQYPFSNTFESYRPASRTERLSNFPYRPRRSTVPGHPQGHHVNDSRPLVAHEDVMLSDSASPSPIVSPIPMFPSASPTQSSIDSPKASSLFYDRPLSSAFASPLHSSFSLCPSPEFPNHLGYPRSMPPSFIPSSLSSEHNSTMRNIAPAPNSWDTANHVLSPSPPNSFPVDPRLDLSDPACSPRLHHESGLANLTREELEGEMLRFQQRIHDLELDNEAKTARMMEMEEADSKARVQNELGLFDAGLAASASVGGGGLEQWVEPVDWDKRTEARLKLYCSLNRAGNALCAWHDSRRERRAYPPRMAPPNTLNCGCTFEEALFEESLARNNVGAFYPGESVRMDPALRNPLLKLLQRRYDYRDGDFERLPDGTWKEGEDPQTWEQRVCNNRSTSKRDRG